MKKFSLEQIMGAWSKYKTPLHFYNGEKVSVHTYKKLMGREEILTNINTHLEQVTRYELGISFPEFLMEELNK